MTLIASAVQKMIDFYAGNAHDIAHFLKVWAYAKTIGELEGLDAHTQQTLELAAIVHDIACPLCREKYGNTDGKNQERESDPLVREFFRDSDLTPAQIDRIAFIVSHHHTYTNVDAIDYQIMLEADYLVNADESHFPKENITNALDKIFRTESGKALLRSIYFD